MLKTSMGEAERSQAVRSAVEAYASGPVEDAVATVAVWKFPHPDGHVSQAEVWVLRTPGQLWTAAVSEDDQHLAAVGDPEAVGVVRGWARDQIRVGGRSFALPRKVVDAAEAMVAAFKANAGGAAFPPPPATPITGPLAEGAVGLPDWWSDSVPGHPDDPWLAGFPLATEWTFNVDGGHRTTPLVLGIRSRGLAVAARADDQRYVAEIPAAVTTSPGRFGRTLIEAGPFRLDAGRLDRARAERIARLANADAPERWALTAAGAMDDGRPADAVALWRSALTRGYRSAVAVDLAVAALAVDRSTLAVALLREAGPRIESGWMAPLPSWRRTVSGDGDALVALLDDVVVPADPPGPGWPWPPASPAEAWAAAGGPATLPEPPGDPRRLQVQAAVAEQREPAPVAAAAYRVAARAWAAAEDPEAAYRTLGSALRLQPASPDHFQAAIWAYAAGAQTDAMAHVEAGLAVSPSAEPLFALEPGADVLHRAAEVAEAGGHRATAARLAIRAMEIGVPPADREAKLALARRIDTSLRQPNEAAALIESVAEAEEGQAVEGLEALWIEAAKLRRRAGASAEALTALRRAVQAGFLRHEVYRDAAAVAKDHPDLAGWWNHMAWALSGTSPQGRARPAASELSRSTLDGLHPGGEGWLEDMTRWLQAPTPPARDHLIRGLERMESGTYGEVFGTVNDVSRRLELVPPPTYVYRGDDAYGLSAWPVQPPVLLVGHQHLTDGPRQLRGDALTFAVAVELVHLAAGHPILSFDAASGGTSRSAYRAFGRFAGTAETVVDLMTLIPGIGQATGLWKLMQISKRLISGWKTVNKASNLASPVVRWFGGDGASEDAGGIGRARLEGAALQFRLQADRAALLLCGSLSAAVEAILKTSPRGVVKLEAFARDGLAPLLDVRSDALAADEIVRLSALVAWSSGLGTANDVDASGRGV